MVTELAGSHAALTPGSGEPTAANRRRLRSSLPGALAFAGAFGLVLAYALRGGAYDLVVRQEYGIVLWWILGLGFACGLLPRTMPARLSWVLPGILLAYAAWTALSLGWTESSERTTAEIARE